MKTPHAEPSVDLIVFSNIWNELVHGFKVGNFELPVDISTTAAVLLLAQIYRKEDGAISRLTAEQIEASSRALNLCVDELGSEFQSRIGVEPSQAREIIASHVNSAR